MPREKEAKRVLRRNNNEAVGKRPSAALPSSLVTAAYFYVRLIPRDFGSLAYGHFPSASKKAVFRQAQWGNKGI
jgi:hypothetical protein